MNEAIFKTTVMGGFNKSDVLAFIDKQDKRFKDREKDLIIRVDSLSTGLKSETQNNEKLTKRVAELESQLEEEKQKNLESTRKLQEASITVSQIKGGMNGEIENRDAELDKMRVEACELTRKLNEAEAAATAAAARADEFKSKLSLIDKTQDQIGRAILESQKVADKILSSAKEEAAAITDKAKKEASDLISHADEHVQSLNSKAQDKLDLLLREVADYEKRVSDTRADTAEFFRAVDTVFTSMQNNADDILTKFSSAFKVDGNPAVSDETVPLTDEAETAQSTEHQSAAVQQDDPFADISQTCSQSADTSQPDDLFADISQTGSQSADTAQQDDLFADISQTGSQSADTAQQDDLFADISQIDSQSAGTEQQDNLFADISQAGATQANTAQNNESALKFDFRSSDNSNQ